jgi:hypothetical protein
MVWKADHLFSFSSSDGLQAGVGSSSRPQLAIGLVRLNLLRDLHDLNQAFLATGDGQLVALDLGGIGELIQSRIISLW